MKPATVFLYSIVYAFFISLSGFYRKILTTDNLISVISQIIVWALGHSANVSSIF